MGGPVGLGNNIDNNRRNFNAYNNWSNDSEMTLAYDLRDFISFSANFFPMKTYNDLYPELCSYENLEIAFKKARKRKTLKPYVVEFESNLERNLLAIQFELQTFTYKPSSLTTFIIRDPKTRKISASHFRDRVVYHALCNVISPFLGNCFISDSFANRKGKGTHPAIKRFEQFLVQLTFNHKLTLERERERVELSAMF